MNSADLLQIDDRCARSAFWSLSWEPPKLHPTEILRMAIDDGMASTDDDPGDFAGSRVMETFSLRQVDTKQNQLYDLGVHLASLADIVTTVLRSGAPWGRPADTWLGDQVWTSGAWLDANGVRLHRLVVVDRWSPERQQSELHSWRTTGEWAAYGLPLTLHIVVIGQSREGKHISPWTRGYLHPVGNQTLRFQKRNGTGLTGAGWKQVWREEVDHLSREKWIDAMHADGVLKESVFTVDVPVPIAAVVEKVRYLAEKKLRRIRETKERPDPCPSMCDWPTKCGFHPVCWQFRKAPTERDGFIRLR